MTRHADDLRFVERFALTITGLWVLGVSFAAPTVIAVPIGVFGVAIVAGATGAVELAMAIGYRSAASFRRRRRV